VGRVRSSIAFFSFSYSFLSFLLLDPSGMHYVRMSGTAACWICYVGLVAQQFVHQCTVFFFFCKNFPGFTRLS
jgi:hypothetical protein